MTISEYLAGSFDFKFSDLNILSVLTRRNIDKDAPFETVSERDAELAKADLYIILANVVSGGGRKIQKGNRSVSERSYTFGVYDRREFREAANEIYAKWGESSSIESPVAFLGLYDNQ